jgi:hypothetical protein
MRFDCSCGRHTGAGRHPVKEHIPRSGQNYFGIDPLRGDFSINWIPACAGMTVNRVM